VVELLLKHGASVTPVDEDGLTALLIAVGEDHAAVVDLLLKRGAGADDEYTVRATVLSLLDLTCGQDGWTALHIAAWKNHADVARALLHHGADVNAKEKASSSFLTDCGL